MTLPLPVPAFADQRTSEFPFLRKTVSNYWLHLNVLIWADQSIQYSHWKEYEPFSWSSYSESLITGTERSPHSIGFTQSASLDLKGSLLNTKWRSTMPPSPHPAVVYSFTHMSTILVWKSVLVLCMIVAQLFFFTWFHLAKQLVFAIRHTSQTIWSDMSDHD